MEYFKSGLKSVLGTPQEGSQPTGAETVCNKLGSVRFTFCHRWFFILNVMSKQLIKAQRLNSMTVVYVKTYLATIRL